jgi:hypothetical protein
MLETLITSKTRIKLLMKFFLNTNAESYLRNLELEFGGSTNGIRVELNKFENAGLLSSKVKGNKKYFKANTNHPLFPDIHNILLKHVGVDKIIENIVDNLGSLYQVYIVGDYAKGISGQIIDLVFVGYNIDTSYLLKLVDKAEKSISCKIRYLVFSTEEIHSFLLEKNSSDYLLLWENDKIS